MAAFFKLILHGFLYAIGLPFFVIALAIYSLYCLVMFIYEAIRSLFVFFKGGTPFGDLKEDAEAKKILLERQNAPKEQNNAQPQSINIFLNQGGLGQAPQGNDSYNPNQINNGPRPVGEVDLTDPIKGIDEKGGNY